MKQGIILLILGLVLVACQSEQGSKIADNSYRISVQIPDQAGALVTLRSRHFDRLGRDRVLVMDTTQLDTQGQAILEGPVTEALVSEVLLDGTVYPVFLRPAQSLRLVASAEGQTPRWQGPGNPDRLREWYAQIQSEYRQLAAWGQAEEAALQAGDKVQADSLRGLRSAEAHNYWQDLLQLADSTADPLMAVVAVEQLDWGSHFNAIRLVSNRLLGIAPTNPYVLALQGKVVAWEMQREKDGAKSMLGQSAPAIEGKGLNGQNITLAQLHGKTVLVDFWASWCAPCRKENPNIVAAYERYHDRGFEVLSVSLDAESTAWQSAIKSDGLQWTTHVRVEGGFADPICRAFGVNAIPAGFLVDANGLIVAERSELRGNNLMSRLGVLLGP